jgi:hypothetical protein
MLTFRSVPGVPSDRGAGGKWQQEHQLFPHEEQSLDFRGKIINIFFRCLFLLP